MVRMVHILPSFSHIYKLSSVLNTGKGNQWYGYNVEKVGMLEDAKMYERAKKFYSSFANRSNNKSFGV